MYNSALLTLWKGCAELMEDPVSWNVKNKKIC